MREIMMAKDESKDATVADVEAESAKVDEEAAKRREEVAGLLEPREPDDEMASPALVRAAPPADPAFAAPEPSSLDARLERGEPLVPEDGEEADESASVE